MTAGIIVFRKKKCSRENGKISVLGVLFVFLRTIPCYISSMIQEKLILTDAEKFDIISKNSAEGVIIINDTGSIEEWNDYMVDKTGYPKNEILGRKIWNVQYAIMTKEKRKTYPLKALREIWMNFFRDLDENEFITKEGQFLSLNKELILTEDIICRTRLQNKNYLYVIQRDRGRKRKAGHEDVMASIISYELKSLISNLNEFSGLFTKENRRLNIDKLLNFIRQALSSSVHTVKLLENFSVFLSVQSGNFGFRRVKINLNQIFEEIIGEYRARALSKNIEMNYVPSTDIFCSADINMLKIILRNLVDNALKFTHEYGKVEISASRKKDFVEIMIKDNGVGIDKETQKKLFLSDSNVSTKGTRGEEGSGLGLIISKNLVEKQGGKIWVDSAVDRNSTFGFTIPV